MFVSFSPRSYFSNLSDHGPCVHQGSTPSSLPLKSLAKTYEVDLYRTCQVPRTRYSGLSNRYSASHARTTATFSHGEQRPKVVSTVYCIGSMSLYDQLVWRHRSSKSWRGQFSLTGICLHFSVPSIRFHTRAQCECMCWTPFPVFGMKLNGSLG